jgi:transglutaminase-like putative cysteine protease
MILFRGRAARGVPATGTCAVALVAAALSLRLLGLRRTMALAHRVADRPAPVGRQPVGLIGTTAWRVMRAAAFYPGRAECLEQSLAIFALLRRRGVPVELRLGVQSFPFAAHAWVEYKGRPVNEREEIVARMAPFPSIGG